MKLGRMKDGRFFKNIGYLESGSQQKFWILAMECSGVPVIH